MKMNKPLTPYFSILDLDTKLFGFKVAKILNPRLTTAKLGAVLNELHSQNVRLVYWPSDSSYQPAKHAALKFNGFLSSEQATYLIEIDHPTTLSNYHPADSSIYHHAAPCVYHPADSSIYHQAAPCVYHPADSSIYHQAAPCICHPTDSSICHHTAPFVCHPADSFICHPAAPPAGSIPYYIEEYQLKTPTTELKQLALQAGTYSRFCVDPNFPKKLFLKLYNTWIKNSVNGTIASKILTIQHKNKTIGMITLGSKNNRGDIGLLAINAKFRGKNLGTELVYAAQNYFIKNGFTKIQVVTQKINAPACHLYEKCGFHLEKIENFYHFWL